jgi:hypothetical protein
MVRVGYAATASTAFLCIVAEVAIGISPAWTLVALRVTKA